MTFRRSMIAAALLLGATSAYAGDTSTDAARARAAAASHAGHTALASPLASVPGSTDQARALAAGAQAGEAPSRRPMSAPAGDCACHQG
jgi:hypothetical protein